MRSARILLVEDDSDVLAVNAGFLHGKGYEVQCIQTLAEARALLWEQPFDLIILDVMLPDGSGVDFCREVRGVSSVMVLFLSCLGEDAQVASGLLGGGDDYMVKPYSLEVLGARVAALLRRSGAIKGKIELPPLYIDLSSGTVVLDGESLLLTRKEFQLLTYLVENRGLALSQEDIYQAVWGGPPETCGNTVKVNISRLRSKLHLNDASAFELSSVPGRGYMFLRVRYPEAR